MKKAHYHHRGGGCNRCPWILRCQTTSLSAADSSSMSRKLQTRLTPQQSRRRNKRQGFPGGAGKKRLERRAGFWPSYAPKAGISTTCSTTRSKTIWAAGIVSLGTPTRKPYPGVFVPYESGSKWRNETISSRGAPVPCQAHYIRQLLQLATQYMRAGHIHLRRSNHPCQNCWLTYVIAK